MSKGATRFAKGQSGNPKGRPRKAVPRESAFDVIIDQTLTVTQNGVERELTIDEALQLQTYQAALKGSRSARREVLKMIAKREKWIADKTPKQVQPVTLSHEEEARTADEAMLLLGIATRRPPHECWADPKVHLALENWVMDAGLKRCRRKTFTKSELADLRRAVADPAQIRWP